MIRVLCWEQGLCRDVSLEEGGAAWRERGASVWVDVAAPDRAQMERIAALLGLHDMVVRDALQPNSRPRTEDFGDFISITLYVPHEPGASQRGAPPFGIGGSGLGPLSEIDFVFAARYLVTAHQDDIPLLDRLRHNARDEATVLEQGFGALVREVLDEAVDSYFPVLDKLVEQVEDIQEFAFVGGGSAPPHDALRPLFQLKKGLLALRRVMEPQADALRVLAREGVSFYREPVEIDFQGVFDRAVRVEQTIQLNQDLLINARESYLTRVSNELAVATRALLVVTCVILVPFFFSALYGTNFDLIPETKWPIGQAWAIGLIVLTDGVILLIFRRQHLM